MAMVVKLRCFFRRLVTRTLPRHWAQKDSSQPASLPQLLCHAECGMFAALNGPSFQQ